MSILSTVQKAIYTNLANSTTADVRRKTSIYLNSVINSEDGWRQCLGFLSSNIDQESLPLHFFTLRILFVVLSHRDHSLTEEDLALLKQTMVSYISRIQDTPHSELKNKFSQILVLVLRLKAQYISRFLNLVFLANIFEGSTAVDSHHGRGPPVQHVAQEKLGMVDLLFRVLLHLHTFVSQTSTPGERLIGSKIKDQMKVECLPSICKLWYSVLDNPPANDPLARMALKLISRYIRWIDITLIVNPYFIATFVGFVQRGQYIAPTLQCISQILKKGMPSLEKTQVIGQLRIADLLKSILSSAQEPDVDVLIQTAKITNLLGVESLSAINEAARRENTPALEENAQKLLQCAIISTFKLFGSEWDDVASCLTPFLQQYLLSLKPPSDTTEFTLAPNDQKNLTELWKLIFKKFQYLDEEDLDEDDEDQFEQFRSELHKLCLAAIRIHPPLAIRFMKHLADTSIAAWQTVPWIHAEAALQIINILPEALSVKQIKTPSYLQILEQIACRIIQTRVGDHLHPKVSFIYFEFICRFDTYVTPQQFKVHQLTLRQYFVRGLKSSSPQVKNRACYLLERLVHSRGKMFPPDVKKQIYLQLLPFLRLEPQAEREKTSGLELTSIIHLYEAAAKIIMHMELPPQAVLELVEKIILPLGDRLRKILDNRMFLNDTPRDHPITDYAVNILQVIGHFASVFSITSEGLTKLFISMTNYAMALLKYISESSLRQQVIILLRQMIERLRENIFPYIGTTFSKILKLPGLQPEDLVEMIRFVDHLASRFAGPARSIIITLFPLLFQPIVQAMTRPCAEHSDEEVSLFTLRQSFFSLMYVMVKKDLADIFLVDNLRPIIPNLMKSLLSGLAISRLAPRQFLFIKQSAEVLLVLLQILAQDFPRVLSFGTSSIIPSTFNLLKDPRLLIEDANIHQTLTIFVRIHLFLLTRSPSTFHQALNDLDLPSRWLATYKGILNQPSENLIPTAKEGLRQLIKTSLATKNTQK